MKPRSGNTAISTLRWVLGLVVFLESARFALTPAAGHQLAEIGFPTWVPPILGGSEALAALLFLLPASRLIGGYALVFIFAIAAAVHVLHGQFVIGSLIVYAMAVIVCLTQPKRSVAEALRER